MFVKKKKEEGKRDIIKENIIIRSKFKKFFYI